MDQQLIIDQNDTSKIVKGPKNNLANKKVRGKYY